MMNETNKNTWCVNAFHSLSANNDGTVKLCCMHREYEHVYLQNEGIKGCFNHPNFIKVREDLESGIQNKECHLCWKEEEIGRKSKRLDDNQRYFERIKNGEHEYKDLSIIELNLGNICNLKCRTCGSHSSSVWMKEEYDILLKDKYPTYNLFVNDMKNFYETYNDDSTFWEDLDSNVENLRRMNFFGGEPLMSKKMWRTLQKIVDKNISYDVELTYATNGTYWPKEVEIWKKFKYLSLTFSIDGIGDQFTFMRHPANWNKVKEVMELAREFKKSSSNTTLNWIITCSSLNIYNLPEIITEYRKNYSSDFSVFLNLVHTPEYLNISHLPDYSKDELIKKLQKIDHNEPIWEQVESVINFIKNGKFDNELWKEFLFRVNAHDEYRKENFAETFSDWAKILRFIK